MDATGVNPSGSLPVVDFNVVRRNAARSEHNFFGRGTARSHGTNVTSVKPRRAPNSFPHSESNQIKNAINFSVWRKFIQFQEANGTSDGMGDFDFGRHAGSTCKTPGCQNISAFCIFTPKIRRKRLKFTNSFTRNAALTALPLTNLHLRTQQCAPTFVSRKLILRGVQNGLIIIFPLQRGRILDLSLLLLQRNPASRIYLRLRCIVLQHFGNLMGTLTLCRLWTQTYSKVAFPFANDA